MFKVLKTVERLLGYVDYLQKYSNILLNQYLTLRFKIHLAFIFLYSSLNSPSCKTNNLNIYFFLFRLINSPFSCIFLPLSQDNLFFKKNLFLNPSSHPCIA